MKEYIVEYKKVIPSRICEKIISYFDFDYQDAGIMSGKNKNIRNCLTRSILQTKTFGEAICANAVKEKIFHCVDAYNTMHDVKIDKISQLDILKYEKNEFDAGYKFHTDMGAGCSDRHLSISICLNNEYEGGEFVFNLPSGKYTMPQNVGDAVIFPSNFMFPHQVNRITKGTRYALIGWVV